MQASSTSATTGAVSELQQVQLLMSTMTSSASHLVRSVTLSDAATLIQTMQERYGAEASLEDIIQAQIGVQLRVQVEQRRARRATSRQGGAS